jgi:outer membrane protein OmpA-like peptidoglycan-associated protein
MKKLTTFILFIFFIISISAQIKFADILYDNFEYELAADFYNKADSLNQNQLKKHALCFYLKNEFHSSIPLFEKAILRDSSDIFLKYHYGVSLKSVGRYNAAKEIFNAIYNEDSLNPYLKLHLNSIDSLMKWDTIHFFKKLAGFDELNTKSSEFSPLFYDQGIYYILENGRSNSKRKKKIKLLSKSDTLSNKEKKLFIQKMDSTLTYGRLISPKTFVYKTKIDVSQLFKDYSDPIPSTATDSAQLLIKHNKFNITSFSATNKEENIFFTRNPIINKWNPESNNNPLIFKGKINPKKPKLKKRKRLKIKSLPLIYGSGEVSVTSDGKSVYFISDKKKGLGGTDIYVAHKKSNGNWTKAKNLGPTINTTFDEESPRIYDDSILYFSSNGWPGYGKADIFRCKIINDSIFNFEHLPYPINSSGEDIHFSLHPFDESIGVLNSNRSKGMGDEDIYFAYMIPVEPYVKGYIKQLPDSSIQSKALVKLFNNNNHELNQTTTKINGIYRFSLEMDSTYKVCATKTGLSGCIFVNADESLFRNEKRDIYLDSAITFQGYIVDEKNKKVDNCEIEFYDKKDKVIATIYSREDGFFQLKVNKKDDFFVMAFKGEKAGTTKIKITEDYKTDSITTIMIYNNRAIIHGIVYDTNGLPSNNAVVRLLDSNNNEVERITTKESGEYQLSMTTLHYYRIIATNYGMTKDSSFYVDLNWKPNQRKDFYLDKNTTVQGVTYFSDSTTILDDVKIAIESGLDSKYFSIYSDKNGFFQFPLCNDSLILILANKKKMVGNIAINIDSTYSTKSLNNIYLHKTTTDAHGLVINNSDSVVKGLDVELINKDGILESETLSDSLGYFYFELDTDTDYEIYASYKDLEAIANIHTGVLWNKNENIILKLSEKGTPTYGLVIDGDSDVPLNFVKITLTDSATNLKNITYSNELGSFEMSLKKNSTNYIKLEKENYFTKTIIVKIGDTVPKVIDLSRDYNLTLTKSNFHIDPIYFEFDSHQITPNSKIELDKLALWLKGHKGRRCTIYGYTDCRGQQKYNLNLSSRRAETVSKYISKQGVSSKYIITKARGATNYVNNCYSVNECTEAEHRENRRCEFEINDK